MKKYLISASVAAFISGCAVTPQTEATPVNMVEIHGGKIVKVESRGPHTIVCQDYWQRFTLWDRAVVAPEGMSRADADAICRSKQQMATEKPTSKPWEPVFNHKRNNPDPMLAEAANDQVSHVPGDIRATVTNARSAKFYCTDGRDKRDGACIEQNR